MGRSVKTPAADTGRAALPLVPDGAVPATPAIAPVALRPSGAYNTALNHTAVLSDSLLGISREVMRYLDFLNLAVKSIRKKKLRSDKRDSSITLNQARAMITAIAVRSSRAAVPAAAAGAPAAAEVSPAFGGGTASAGIAPAALPDVPDGTAAPAAVSSDLTVPADRPASGTAVPAAAELPAAGDAGFGAAADAAAAAVPESAPEFELHSDADPREEFRKLQQLALEQLETLNGRDSRDAAGSAGAAPEQAGVPGAVRPDTDKAATSAGTGRAPVVPGAVAAPEQAAAAGTAAACGVNAFESDPFSSAPEKLRSIILPGGTGLAEIKRQPAAAAAPALAAPAAAGTAAVTAAVPGSAGARTPYSEDLCTVIKITQGLLPESARSPGKAAGTAAEQPQGAGYGAAGAEAPGYAAAVPAGVEAAGYDPAVPAGTEAAGSAAGVPAGAPSGRAGTEAAGQAAKIPDTAAFRTVLPEAAESREPEAAAGGYGSAEGSSAAYDEIDPEEAEYAAAAAAAADAAAAAALDFGLPEAGGPEVPQPQAARPQQAAVPARSQRRHSLRRLEPDDFLAEVEKQDAWMQEFRRAGIRDGAAFSALCSSTRTVDPQDPRHWILCISSEFELLLQPGFIRELEEKFSAAAGAGIRIEFKSCAGTPEGCPLDLARQAYRRALEQARAELAALPGLQEILQDFGEDLQTVGLSLCSSEEQQTS